MANKTVIVVERESSDGERTIEAVCRTMESARQFVEKRWSGERDNYDDELEGKDLMGWLDDELPVMFGVMADDDPDGQLPCWTLHTKTLI